MRLPAKAGPRLPLHGLPSAQLTLDIIDKFPGPAIAVDHKLQVLAANVHAGLLEDSLTAADSPVVTILQRTIAHKAPITHKVTLRGKAGVHHVDLTAIPGWVGNGKQSRAGTPAVFLLARDTTIEQNLTQALVDSRQMFKDMLVCTGAFAWETDTGGILRYVSPKGAFGYAAHEMTGRTGRDFIANSDELSGDLFATRDRIDNVEFRIWRADGSQATVLMSALAIVGQDGRWLGSRGVCRDITAEVEQSQALRRLVRSEALSADILALAGHGRSRDELIHSALKIITDAWGARCAAFLMDEGGLKAIDPGDLANKTNLRSMIAAMAITNTDNDVKPLFLSEPGGVPLLVVPIRLGSTVLGAISIDMKNLPGDDGSVAAPFELAANALGLILDHARLSSASVRAPGIDNLNSLLSSDELQQALGEQLDKAATSKSGSQLLILELDGFLAVLSRIDHAIGEAILNDFAGHLKDSTRDGDLLAWVGNGRFAVWLGNSDIDGAANKVERWKVALRKITSANGLDKGALALSCGIASWTAMAKFGGSAMSLFALATGALGLAKRKGRGHWALALDDGSGQAKDK